MDRKYDSGGRGPNLQVWSPDFKYQSYERNNQRVDDYEQNTLFLCMEMS
jgi:hypothetical protein